MCIWWIVEHAQLHKKTSCGSTIPEIIYPCLYQSVKSWGSDYNVVSSCFFYENEVCYIQESLYFWYLGKNWYQVGFIIEIKSISILIHDEQGAAFLIVQIHINFESVHIDLLSLPLGHVTLFYLSIVICTAKFFFPSYRKK